MVIIRAIFLENNLTSFSSSSLMIICRKIAESPAMEEDMPADSGLPVTVLNLGAVDSPATYNEKKPREMKSSMWQMHRIRGSFGFV
jgi:hypothetical protein